MNTNSAQYCGCDAGARLFCAKCRACGEITPWTIGPMDAPVCHQCGGSLMLFDADKDKTFKTLRARLREALSAQMELVELTPRPPFVQEEDMSHKGSHYVPRFTRFKNLDGYPFQETACGLFVGWSACAPAETEPSCPSCRVWLGLQNETEGAETHV